MAGVNLNTVRELMGHKSLTMTLRYAHLSPGHKKRAVEILDTQMDTIWLPERNKEEKAENLSLQSIENIGSYDKAGMVKLVNAVDSKSTGLIAPAGSTPAPGTKTFYFFYYL